MNLDSFSLSITFRNIPNRICSTASKFDKQILKIGRRRLRSLEYEDCGSLTVLFWKKINGKERKKES